MNCAMGGPLPYLPTHILFSPSHNDVDVDDDHDSNDDDDNNYDDVVNKNYNDDDDAAATK